MLQERSVHHVILRHCLISLYRFQTERWTPKTSHLIIDGVYKYKYIIKCNWISLTAFWESMAVHCMPGMIWQQLNSTQNSISKPFDLQNVTLNWILCEFYSSGIDLMVKSGCYVPESVHHLLLRFWLWMQTSRASQWILKIKTVVIWALESISGLVWQ